MVFGRFFRNEKLESQKAAWRACELQIRGLEQRATSVGAMRDRCPDGWQEGLFQGQLFKARQCREIFDVLGQRLIIAKSELPKFDEQIAFLNHNVPIFDEGFRHIAATVFARQLVSNEDRLCGRTRQEDPSARDCQLALQRLAEELYPQLLNHVAKVRETGTVTPLMQQIFDVGLPDLGKAIATSRAQLDAAADSLGLGYTVVLSDIISRIEQYSTEIGNAVSDDVVADALREAMQNSALK